MPSASNSSPISASDRLAKLEAGLARSVNTCRGDLAKLLDRADFSSLLGFCESTRLVFPALLRVEMCANQCPLRLANEFLGAMDLGLRAGHDVTRDERQQLTPENRRAAQNYLGSIALRRESTAILSVRGAEAAYQYLANELISVLSQADDPVLQEFAEELRTRVEHLGLDLSPADDVRAGFTAAITTASLPVKYQAVLLAKAFRGLCMQLRSHCAELLHEAGPFVDSIEDHITIAEHIWERLQWFASELDRATLPSDEQHTNQALETYRSALRACHSTLHDVRKAMAKTHGELEKREGSDQELEETARVEIQKVTRAVLDLERRAAATWREITQMLPGELQDQVKMSIIDVQTSLYPLAQAILKPPPDVKATFQPTPELVAIIERSLIPPPESALQAAQERSKALFGHIKASELSVSLGEIISREVEGTCADFARRAAAESQPRVPLSERGRFDRDVGRELLEAFAVDLYEARAVLDQLHRELFDFASDEPRERNWGRITTDGSSLMLEVDIEEASAVPDLEQLGPEYWNVTP